MSGDVNGDGISDLLISAPYGIKSKTYVVFGGSNVGNSGTFDSLMKLAMAMAVPMMPKLLLRYCLKPQLTKRQRLKTIGFEWPEGKRLF